jgi:hypothetical protein
MLYCCLRTIATSVEDSRRPPSAFPLFYPYRWHAPGCPAVDRSDVCWKTCFVFASHIRAWPADNYRAYAAFLSVCYFPNTDSFLYAIIVCRAFDPRPLVDLVCVSPRVVSTRLFLDIVDLVVTFTALRPYAPFIAPVDYWTVVLCYHRARVSRTRFCAC